MYIMENYVNRKLSFSVLLIKQNSFRFKAIFIYFYYLFIYLFICSYRLNLLDFGKLLCQPSPTVTKLIRTVRQNVNQESIFETVGYSVG